MRIKEKWGAVRMPNLQQLQEAQEVDYIPFYVPRYQFTVPLMQSVFPEPPNGTITTYPDPSILPDRFAYGSGDAGLQPNPTVPLMKYNIPNLVPNEPTQDTSQWVMKNTIAAPIPNFTNSVS